MVSLWRSLKTTMKNLIKPKKLNKGDTIATISPSWGCAGGRRVRWKYELGVKRLEELGINVVSAPNSLRGTSYLRDNPQARAEDLMWAFENKQINGIIANIGGNDSGRLLPFLSSQTITNNPKIFCGYSDVMTLHLYCYQAGLATFYGDNLLTTIADGCEWHTYSKYWFEKVLFDSSKIGNITPSSEWSNAPYNHTNKQYTREYVNNSGYSKIQGTGKTRGKLFGGHSGLAEYGENSLIRLCKADFEDKILFFEEIPEFATKEYISDFFNWLGSNGYLQVLNGIVIGKIMRDEDFMEAASVIRSIVSYKYGMEQLPIMYGLNFGHTSPICILPYGAEAIMDVDELTFAINDSGVR